MNHDRNTMTKHLRSNGYMENYTMPVNDGEHECSREEVTRQHIDGDQDDGIRDMLDDLHRAETPHSGEEPEHTAKVFFDTMASAKKHLYEGAQISQLDSISQLLAVKARYGCSRACFEAFLAVWGNQLPEDNVLP